MNTQYILKYLLVLCSSILILQCTSDPKPKKNSDGDDIYEVRISNPAGDEYFLKTETDTFSYLPYPFNVGTLLGSQELSCIVISNRLSARSKIKVQPIGLFSYDEDGEEQRMIIMIPDEKEKRIIDAENFLDLVARYPSVKNIIQEWVLGKCGIGCARLKAWDDENAAGLLLQRAMS